MTAHDVETERSRAVTDRPYNLQVHPVFLGSCDFPGGNRGSEVPLQPAVYVQPRVVRGRFWDLMLSRVALCLVSVPLSITRLRRLVQSRATPPFPSHVY